MLYLSYTKFKKIEMEEITEKDINKGFTISLFSLIIIAMSIFSLLFWLVECSIEIGIL